MTMNDHKGEGFRNDHVVRWTEMFYFRSENGCMNSSFEQLHAGNLEQLCSFT